MSNGIYLGKDYHIHREDGYHAALCYLQKKREERKANHVMAIIGWTIGALCVWGIIAVMYYGY